MGGLGEHYDRDVTDKTLRNSSGVSSVAERAMSQTSMDPALLPMKRRLVCMAKNPLVYDFDVTGSMGNLPKIIYDKWPGIIGQIVAHKYLKDPEMSIAATGDIRSDSAPLQMADFSPLRNLDKWLECVYLEGGGGGQGSESYEMTAYYYAYLCDIPNAEIPVYLITGDESFVENVYMRDLRDHFGGEPKDVTSRKVFADLIKKFKGNVFRIHRSYSGGGSNTNKQIISQWRETLGEDRVILLPEDLAIGDVTLGVYAVVSGSRTVEQYLQDMRTRPLDLGEGVKYEPQSERRISQVEKALEPLKNFKPIKVARRVVAKGKDKSEKNGAVKKKADPEKKKPSWKV